MNKQITIVGSINVDSIMHIRRLPEPGETISMNTFSKAAGGKGANQAVAASRSDADVHFVGAVGDDDNGTFMLNELKQNRIDTTGVFVKSGQDTGQAYILLQETGQNSIIVQSGANGDVDAAIVNRSKSAIEASDFTITQFETPIEAALEAFKTARHAGKITILNPAPAKRDIPTELLSLTDIIIPNETESELISGIRVDTEESLRASAEFYHRLGIRCVIITLGERGCYVSRADEEPYLVPAFKVNAVDTTAAGDTFIGALAAELSTDLSNLKDATRYASMASSKTVQTLGAFPSIPTKQDVEASLKLSE